MALVVFAYKWGLNDKLNSATEQTDIMETHTSTFCVGLVVLFSFWCSSPSVAFATSEEANALLQWKNSLPKESQSVLSSWTLHPQNNSSSGPCSWRGIISCNAESVAEMDLSGSGLTGTLDEFPFTSLPKLTHIDFSENQFSGIIPSQISYLSELVYLDLSTNNFSGKIPPEIGQLQHLEILHLALNHFNGSLPSEIGNLKSLTDLDLTTNNLEGPIPVSLGNLINLTWLSLSNSSFSGPIPSTFGNLKKLTTFWLFGNKLAGPIPSELGNMASLTSLALAENFLTGPIPASFGNLTNLVELWLYENHLSGPVPKELGNLTSLVDLVLSQNKLSGPIPSELGNLTSLTLLILSNNYLNGTIPSELGNLTSLTQLFLSNNYLSGSIPKSICSLINLFELNLSENQLSGQIPSSMANLVNLSYLSLASNNLSGTNANFTLPKLENLDLSFCGLNQFPEFIRESNNLTLLDLSSNKIEGPIPKWMWDLGKDTLEYLLLSNNSLTGGLESFLWKNIVYIDLRSNMFQGVLPILPNGASYLSVSNNFLIGEIPSEICNANILEILDLSYNNFSGKVPNCLFKFSKILSVLNLQMNNFQGKVPSELFERCQLQNLNLHGNQMEGPLPRSLANCGKLEVLDIGNNNIKDTFPTWLGSLSELQVLVLRSNSFHGIVSSNIDANSSFPKLRILDLSDNDFNGSLPARFIENLKAMVDTHEAGNSPTYMQSADLGYDFSVFVTLKGQDMEMEKILTIFTSIDLSKNKFIGEIPDAIGSLHSLKGLNLSHNNLGGPITPSIRGLTNLESLDLSCNKLVGRIPEELLSLTQLAVLNLSNNQLVGHIPLGNQLGTFGNDSYQGNLGLCGPPVSKTCRGNGTTEQPSASFQEKDEFWEFGWRPIAMGFGCGTLFGFLTGYLMFQMGKPRWFVSLFDFYPYLRARRMNQARKRIQRRN